MQLLSAGPFFFRVVIETPHLLVGQVTKSPSPAKVVEADLSTCMKRGVPSNEISRMSRRLVGRSFRGRYVKPHEFETAVRTANANKISQWFGFFGGDANLSAKRFMAFRAAGVRIGAHMNLQCSYNGSYNVSICGGMQIRTAKGKAGRSFATRVCQKESHTQGTQAKICVQDFSN
jgi:hypothetical protein